MVSIFKKKQVLSEAVQQAVVAAIKEAEEQTTGEIRVYAEAYCRHSDALHRARELFSKLKMTETSARNAVLIYIATEDRKFALFGDARIYEQTGGKQFWEAAAVQLKGHLKSNDISAGLQNCIWELGRALAKEFPFDSAIKKNELPDNIVFGK